MRIDRLYIKFAAALRHSLSNRCLIKIQNNGVILSFILQIFFRLIARYDISLFPKGHCFRNNFRIFPGNSQIGKADRYTLSILRLQLHLCLSEFVHIALNRPLRLFLCHPGKIHAIRRNPGLDGIVRRCVYSLSRHRRAHKHAHQHGCRHQYGFHSIHFKIPFYAAYKNDSNVGTIIASTRIRMMIDDIIFCVFFFLKFMLCSFIRKLPYNIWQNSIEASAFMAALPHIIKHFPHFCKLPYAARIRSI